MLTGGVKVDVSGIAALLSEAKQRNITLKGAKAAGKILKNAARAAAPKRSGALAQSQAVKTAKGTRSGSTSSYAVQGAKKKYQRMYKAPGKRTAQKIVPAFYDHLVQLGTKPHALKRGASVGRKGKGASGQNVAHMHPGAKANPYRRRAWEAVRGEAGEAALAAMAAATEKIVAKQAAKIASSAKGK